MPAFPPVEDQLAIIRRGIEKIVPEAELAEKLKKSYDTGKPLRIKYGIDPTAADVHLGHTVPLRKMRQFQELGHQAVIIIGNYTAMVGDPSGRDEARTKKFTEEEVEKNAQTYLQQVGKVIDLSQAEVHRNGDWFSTMSFAELLMLCGRVTIAQLLTREDFAKRYKEEVPIFLHECLYPIMQAWDSVKIQADVELGGTEQLYSFMLARDLQKMENMPQQIAVMSPILVGLDGHRRMGKSLGNYIGISEPAYEMMKKFMQLPDNVLPMYFELLTNMSMEDAAALIASHPKNAKVELAKRVMTDYHNAEEAQEAADRWQNEIGGSALPTDIPDVTLQPDLLTNGKINAVDLLAALNLVPSKSEARRLIQGGGVKLGEDKQKVDSHDQLIEVKTGLLIFAGKKKYCRIILN
ncbi:tyrosine--tRNA ligase [Lacunimicrobium album]